MGPDWDCWLDPPANLCLDASAVIPAAIALATLAAGFAASQLGEAAGAQAQAEQAYPADRLSSPAPLELLLPLPGLQEVAVVPALPLPRQVCSSR